MKCTDCNEEHDLDDLELGFDYPDAYLVIPKDERAQRAKVTPDLCVIDSARHFIRCVLSVPCPTRSGDFGIGIWSEVSSDSYAMYVRRYRDPAQADEPPFPGMLANDLPAYARLVGESVLVQLTSAKTRPSAAMQSSTHKLARDQRSGITVERALEILRPHLHPESIMPPPN